jgi:ArsR family transcriptional regulator
MSEERECCEIQRIHYENLNQIIKKLPEESLLIRVADLFRIFGDPTRLKILSLLALSECCVCDLAYGINLSQSAVSHQLRILRQARLVKYRKDGKEVFYSLDDDHVASIFKLGLDHTSEHKND